MEATPPEGFLQTPPSGVTSPAMSGALPDDDPPKLKGHQRLLKGLQRMASSPSMERVNGRSRSISTGSVRLGRGSSRGSMSCASLASTISPTQCWDGSSSPQALGKLSDKTSPLSRGLHDEDEAPVRIVEAEIATPNGSNRTSVPLPADIRPGSQGVQSKLSHKDADNQHDVINETDGLEEPASHSWTTLPPELQMEILRCLGPKDLVKCARVSKSWNKMCFDGQLWTELDTSTYYQDVPGDALVRIILNAGPFIKDLNLRGCIQLIDFWPLLGKQIAEVCHNLVSINLEGSSIDKSPIHSLLMQNPSLTRINLCGLSMVRNSALKIIAQYCRKVEYLDVSWCANVDASGLRPVVETCSHLKDLRIGEFSGFNDAIMQGLFNANTLERLSLSQCSTLTDGHLKTMLHGLDPEIDILTDLPIVPPRRLKHLDFSRCHELTDAGIKHLVGNVPDLESLKLSFCPNIGNDAFIDLIRTTPQLAHLDLEELEELTNASIIELSKAPCAPKLEHLNISYCEKLGDPGILQILKRCPSLRSLELDNTRVSDLTLMEICSQMKKRGYGTKLPVTGLALAVFDCGNVTWAGIREILTTNSSGPRLPKPEQATSTKAPDQSVSVLSAMSSSSSLSTTPAADTPPSPPAAPKPNMYLSEIVQLKCYYGWQLTVTQHTTRVLDGNMTAAKSIEKRFTYMMMASEEANTHGHSRSRRRRVRDVEALYHMDDDDDDDDDGAYGYGPAGLAPLGGRRRRARSGGCTVM